MFRTLRAFAVVVCVVSAIMLAPATASAQDEDFSDDTYDAPEYPGPLGDTTADDASDTTSSFSSALPDEVLGQSIDADDAHHDDTFERSIDDRSSDFGNSFVAPDIQPSSDPAAGSGGTGGGLAVTGSEVEPIIAISVGLLAVGGSVLVSSRRRLRDLFF